MTRNYYESQHGNHPPFYVATGDPARCPTCDTIVIPEPIKYRERNLLIRLFRVIFQRLQKNSFH